MAKAIREYHGKQLLTKWLGTHLRDYEWPSPQEVATLDERRLLVTLDSLQEPFTSPEKHKCMHEDVAQETVGTSVRENVRPVCIAVCEAALTSSTLTVLRSRNSTPHHVLLDPIEGRRLHRILVYMRHESAKLLCLYSRRANARVCNPADNDVRDESMHNTVARKVVCVYSSRANDGHADWAMEQNRHTCRSCPCCK